MYSITVSCKNLHSNKVSKLKKDVLSSEYLHIFETSCFIAALR